MCVCVYCTNATLKTIEEILDFFFRSKGKWKTEEASNALNFTHFDGMKRYFTAAMRAAVV